MKTFIDHKIKYQRVIIKISGEALQGKNRFGINVTVLYRILTEIKYLLDLGVEIAIVIGGGNLFRGKQLKILGISHIVADQ
ncbi:MAG TPA: UMP kinase, partial [Buchnera sp. (in: enterobacteria)]|nr:UMP kinase [Buchnera sp. (in: enterobacteria)]